MSLAHALSGWAALKALKTLKLLKARSLGSALALLATLSLAACAVAPLTQVTPTPNPTATPSPTPFPTVTPLPTATAFPSAAAVSSLGGWQDVTSLHWVGYTFPVSNVTGVRAQWIEPTVSGNPGDEEFIWLGVGGWNETVNNIIQVGTFAYFPTAGGRSQGVWYETVPTLPRAQFPGEAVGPGDTIFASVVETQPGSQSWRILLVDGTTGATYDNTVQFQSDEAYPSFVVEDPNLGDASAYGPFYPFPNWKSVSFSNMQIRIGNTWVSAAAQYGYRINMEQNGNTVANAGTLTTSSGFTATES